MELPEMPEPLSNEWQDLNQQIASCRRCERLVAWREAVASSKKRAYRDWDYWGKPVPGFGDVAGRLLVVGLAPGAHGSNRTGRMFTGDASGDFLYGALHRAGFASQPVSTRRDDDLELKDVFISAVGRCAPPDNRPSPEELTLCQPFLLEEIKLLKSVQGVVALGRIAFDRLLKIYLPENNHASEYEFFHGALYTLEGGRPWLLASYHPSRQNTQTGRLTADMFDAIWVKAREMLKN
jgi:uracil-DNA glycosylase